ncbi:PDZ and LIM domain protein Zasp-like isoform X2 [Dinothrombium tinctorium]|uniref:PDZ and LIM domain protein Zasp-like isoform X2 n=1 Tax=Dinothrombium tinctorium TaxID=1965070 RepID=A0A443R1X4_9ACAR|nr:PDZ and LIM domain protein Zasp-like isoform X2 [Dinothrombium tinctorium]
MVGSLITVKLMRGDSSSWGFRLQGGKDWGTALSISKVNPGSLAAQGGLQVGDYVISIQGKNAESMLHKEAQDLIMKAGNNLELQVQRGGTITWSPKVTPVGSLPRSQVALNGEPAPLTKTSLAKNPVEDSKPIGSGYNVSAKPFSPTGPALVHKQFNSPLNLYSMKNIQEAIQAHTEVLAPGVKGINFMKPDAPVNKESAVYRAIVEEEQSHKGDYSFNQQEPGRTSVSPTIQSHAFRKIQQALDTGSANATSPVSSPRTGFPAHPLTKHVEAPISKPRPEAEAPNTCAECGRLIVGVFCRVNEKNLHAECFKCATCGTSLKNTGYFNVSGKLYCDVHAQQAAKLMAPLNPEYEPIAVRPGASIPNNVGILGVGTSPSSLPNAPMSAGSPKIIIPPPSGVSQSGKLSPSVVGAVPWHKSPAGVHHVNAPHSPGKSFTPSVAPPPVAPKPKFRPVSGPAAFYQNQTSTYTGQTTDTHRPVSGAAKFTWPPPKTSSSQEKMAYDGGDKQNAVSSLTRPSHGLQRAAYDSNKVTQAINALIKPQISDTWLGTSYFSQTSVSQSSGQSLSTPGPGQSSIPGSRPAPRRGRGQLKPQVPAGTRVPICSACGTPIRGPFIVALGKTWCPEHFTCANAKCKRNLEDIGFVEEQGQLYCENCFEAYLAPICAKCNVRIKGDCLMALEKQWHPECFNCTYCKKPFGNSCFYLEDGNPYCEKDWNDLFTTKCVGCGFPIEAGDRWVEALNNNYHSRCFKCSVCHKNLEGQSFYAKGGRPYCKSHAR